MPIEAPTIADLKASGLTGVYSVCRACQHSGAVAFDAIGLPDETLFPDIGRARRFRCSACGARETLRSIVSDPKSTSVSRLS